MIFLTTTAIDIDEELLNRCLVLTVNEDIKTTPIYTQVAIRALQQIHAATHPAQLRSAPSELRSKAEREGLLAALAAEEADEEKP